jgi:hypothetical protein
MGLMQYNLFCFDAAQDIVLEGFKSAKEALFTRRKPHI